MIADLTALLDQGAVWLVAAFGVFLRVGACFLVLPGLGEAMIPMRIRLGAAFAMTAVLTPTLAPTLNLGVEMPVPRVILGELVSGLLIGMALRLMVHALQVAGTIAAQATSLSQIMGGASPDPQPAMAALLMLAGVTLAVMSGLHVHLIAAFLRSYGVLPFGLMPAAADVAQWGVAQVGQSFAIAFSLAAPFLIASLVYNVALGVINKAMPQLMVAFVGAPAITWGGLVLLLVSTPLLLPVWYAAFEDVLANPMGAR